MPFGPPSPKRLLLHQPVFLGIAVVVAALLWVLNQQVNLAPVLIYSFGLGNLAIVVLGYGSPLFVDRRFPSNWIAYLCALLVLTPFAVVVVTLLVYWSSSLPGQTFWSYLAASWKLPSLVTLVFGIIYFLYTDTTDRLEQRNLQLQQEVDTSNAAREMQDRELERARDIQQALLPQDIPQIAGFEVSGLWEPARVVGGDYFDVIKLSDTKLAICIADVVGKSVSAALLMANVQATVRAFASDAVSPAWVCSRVNGVLCNNIARDKFVTFFYAVLDSKQRVLAYANAGHLYPLLFANDAVRHLDGGGAVLGVFPEWQYTDQSVPLSPGDRLLLFTDGITEAPDIDGEEYGEDRLIAAARTAGVPPADINRHVLTDVKRFCDSQMQDDATLVTIIAT